MIIVSITVFANLILSLWLLFKGHAAKYRVLFASLLFEVFASLFTRFIYTHYGTNSLAYYEAFHLRKMFSILWTFAIISEGFCWRNRCIRVPQEIYLLTVLVMFLVERDQHPQIFHLLNQTLRYANLAILGWYFYCFRGEINYERRNFRKEA